MQMALEALESDPVSHLGLVHRKMAITALRQALVDADDTSQERVDEIVKDEHEPVTCVCGAVWEGEQMVHAPRPREWVGLTDEDMEALFLNEDGVRFARYIEAKLKEKNQ
jgi:hypothetical protein